MSYRMRANLMMVGVNVFWGLSYVFMKTGLDSLESFNIIALRCLLAFVIAGGFFYRRLLKAKLSTVLFSFLLGMMLFLVFSSVTFGVGMTSASSAGFLVSLTVIFVPILHCLIIRKLPSLPISLGVLFSLTGIGILTLKGSLSINTGDALCIGTALCYAVHILLTGKLTKGEDSITLGVLQLGFAGGIALLFSLIFEDPSLPSTGESWIAILGLGIFCSAVGFICQAVAQRYTTPTHTSLIFATEPIFAALFAVLFLNEVFTLRDAAGAFIIICGILIAQMNSLSFNKKGGVYRRRLRKRESSL
jgi:drug/metabolite transporter (DMT)-like permease